MRWQREDPSQGLLLPAVRQLLEPYPCRGAQNLPALCLGAPLSCSCQPLGLTGVLSSGQAVQGSMPCMLHRQCFCLHEDVW